MTERLELTCLVCGHVGLDDGSDGFFYCQRCGSQAEEIRDTGLDEHDIVEGTQGHAMSHRRHPTVIKAEPISQCQPLSQFWDSLRTPEDENNACDGIGPTEPSDFGMDHSSPSYDDYYSAIRLRYVMGLQIMIELQVRALVEKFNVSPLIVGLVDSIWLRFVASTRIFSDEWADEAIQESESQTQGEAADFEPRARHRTEHHNILGKRAVMIWYQSVSKTIPLPCSLAISFLVCHLAREAVLPTDIVKWALEGKLPYFAAFTEIEKQIGPPSNACPLSSNRMFRPIQPVKSLKLESLAASVAVAIGLELPPVNFYAIASRYLRQLSVPMGIILPHACRIYEWAMPPELWLSANERRRPTRACVISVLIISIRILYNLNGFGKWERGLSCSSGLASLADQGRRSHTNMHDDTGQKRDMGPTCQFDGQPSGLDAAELLLSLEAKYDELAISSEYSKDLPTYLQYCKDVVFSGLEPSFEDHEEEKIIDELWDFYQKKEGVRQKEAPAADYSGHGAGFHKRPHENCTSIPKETKKFRGRGCSSSNSFDECVDDDSMSSCTDQSTCPVHQPTVSFKEERIRQLKSNMEENRFCYISPRQKHQWKRFGYLHYVRKKDGGGYVYAAHADYYILLRACARVAELDVRSLHVAAMNFEKRLEWLEKKINHCLGVLPSIDDVCQFCSDDVQENVTDDPLGFSNLNL